MNVFIRRVGDAPPIHFAVREVERLFRRMDPRSEIAQGAAPCYDSEDTRSLWIGMDPAWETLLPSAPDPALDDGIYVRVRGCAGVVTGSNPRAVLIAAYRLLRENGCAFLFPGEEGELIESRPLARVEATVCEAAANRHRGVCIEGANAYRHVRDMIDWLPKVGMNAYFIQFFTPYTFFERWYRHAGNPDIPGAELSVATVQGFLRALSDEITDRGLLYHAVGHGWTCGAFGVEGLGWEAQEAEAPPHVKPYLAQLDSERGYFQGVPLTTQLCYGNPDVRARLVKAVADYCAAHPEVDYVHFWLGDSAHNHCECPLCCDTLPADFYVAMLKALDALLTLRGLRTRVVFLLYEDLLWAPLREALGACDRFTLMFAPVWRTYTEPFTARDAYAGELPPFSRNHNRMPRSVEENVARLRTWQQRFTGDGFDFDYHFMWDHYLDLGGVSSARILYEDIRNLPVLGLNGLISCQVQRSFYPTGLGMQVLARALWDRDASFEDISREYFRAALGEEGEAVARYLAEISRRFNPPYLRGEKPTLDPQAARCYGELALWVRARVPVLRDNLAVQIAPARNALWRCLVDAAELTVKLCWALCAKAQGDTQTQGSAWAQVVSSLRDSEWATHPYFDLYTFLEIWESRPSAPMAECCVNSRERAPLGEEVQTL